MRFKLLEPISLAEAVGILEQQEDVVILSGGTDLLVKIKTGIIKPSYVLSLGKIPNLNKFEHQEGHGLRIGPRVTHAQVAADAVIQERFTALAKACSLVGSPQIRNLGSVVGNLANASPAADTASALLVMRAELVLLGPKGRRSVSLSNFFRGPGKTILEQGELIEELLVPEPEKGTQSTYYKIGRRKALEIAICGIALAATFKEGHWWNVSLGLGAVGPTPMLGKEASAFLEGQEWSESVIDVASNIAAEQCSPIDDLRATADYRKTMVKVLVQRSIRELISRGETEVNA